jgi:23S rRNA (guanosine2251-2'-O)-methyltransferase
MTTICLAGNPMPQRRHSPRPAQPPAASGQWLYGRHAVTAALANPARRCRRMIALAESEAELAQLLAGARASLASPSPERLDRRAFEALLPADAVHQGMALAVDPLPERHFEDLIDALPESAAPHIIVLLDQVTDPHNVGAILRSAAAFAALAVVVPEHGAPSITGALAKAASGALETVPLVRVTNLSRALERLKEEGFWCVGLAEDAGDSLATLDLPARIGLVLGAEGTGLRRLTRENCDFLARLPTRGTLHSLNVSNAAAVALYELTRRGTGERP